MLITAPQFGQVFVSGPPAGCLPHFGHDNALSAIAEPQCMQNLFGGGVGGFFLIRKNAITITTIIAITAMTITNVISDSPDEVVVVLEVVFVVVIEVVVWLVDVGVVEVGVVVVVVVVVTVVVLGVVVVVVVVVVVDVVVVVVKAVTLMLNFA
jgi:hypothetical protein